MNPNTSLPKIDVARLRNDLLGYYKTLLYNGFSAAQTEITRIQKASDEEIIITAQEEGFDLNAYTSNPNHTETKKQTIPSPQKSQKTKQAVHTNESPQRDFSDLFSGSVAGFLLCIPVIFFCFCINTLVGWVALVGLPIIVTKALFEDEHLMKEEEKEINRLRVQSAIMQFQNERQYGIKSTNSTPTIDTNRLRNDMMNYYGTAMHSGSPMAQADLVHVQRASDAELIREAQKSGFDLNKYTE